MPLSAMDSWEKFGASRVFGGRLRRLPAGDAMPNATGKSPATAYRSPRRRGVSWASGRGKICWPRCSQYRKWNVPRVTCAASTSPFRSLARRPAVRSQARRSHALRPGNAQAKVLGVSVRFMRAPYCPGMGCPVRCAIWWRQTTVSGSTTQTPPPSEQWRQDKFSGWKYQ